MNNSDDDTLQASLLAETSRIPWKELQYFFAGGKTIYVSRDMDLIKVAELIAADDKTAVEKMMQSAQLAPVSNDQAKKWFDDDASVWAVVVKPWVLVQEISE